MCLYARIFKHTNYLNQKLYEVSIRTADAMSIHTARARRTNRCGSTRAVRIDVVLFVRRVGLGLVYRVRVSFR